MRLLEIGPGNTPTLLASDPDVEYVAIDKTKSNNSHPSIIVGDFLEFSPTELGEFDLVYAANVIGAPSINEFDSLAILRKMRDFTGENGQIIVIENYSPPSHQELKRYALEIGGTLLKKGSEDFRDLWPQYRHDEYKLFDAMLIVD